MQQQGYPLEAVAAMAGGSLIGNPGNTMIVELLTDSRKLSSPDQTLFFAIVTSRDNGHKYIGELYKKGIRAICISELPDRTLPDTVYIQVNNTLEAL